MSRKIKVQPIKGKFVSVTSNGRTIRIYLVDPNTMEHGTEVSYEDAIALLALRHPVVCLAQIKGEDGKFIKQFTDEDWKKVNELKDDTANQIAEGKRTETVVSDSSTEDLIKAQAKLIKSQNDQLEMMNKEFAKMQKQIQKLSKGKKLED